MAKCPECDCELAGLERVCRDCFEKQYAVVTGPKKGLQAEQFLIPSLAVAIFAIMFELNRSFPNPMMHLGRTLHITMLVGNILMAGAVVALGIWESLKWRSAQNLLFGVVVGLNLAVCVLFLLRNERYWFFLLAVTFCLNKGMSAFYERPAA